MDKTAIKNFAISARVNLKAAIAQKAFDIGAFADNAAPVSEVQGGFIYNEKSYSKEELAGRKKLIETIEMRADGKGYQHGYTEVIEEAAYTWFNRLIALRFMELNGYLPSGIRILSSTNPDRLEPDCIREAESLDFVDIETIRALSSTTEKLYRYILIAQCNALADTMPRMFERISDYTELLLPDRLYLLEGNIIYDLVHSIKEADFTEQVEIIGWLYQFYISEKKDEVFAGLKKNIKITKENIPAATQLFTPDWIVKYMVENSVGRLAVEQFGIDPAEMKWRFYLPEAEQAAEVVEQLAVIRGSKKDFDIKNVKVIDPCMGSGHILVYAFDVLVQIYEKLGFNAREIPNLILENNLFGLDIDERAGQLAYFALMMKARSYHRRFFRQDSIPQPKVYAIPDYEDWKEYGSIVKLDKPIARLKIGQVRLDDKYADCAEEAAIVSELLCQKYDVVVTNPPYMGSSGMDAKLAEFVKKEYPDSKSDLSTCFMEQGFRLCKESGVISMINIPVWMFLSSYEKLRENIFNNNTLLNMIHFGRGIFGSDFGTVAFIINKRRIRNYTGKYKRLFLKQGAVDSLEQKEKWFFEGLGSYIAQQENFSKIPGMPVAYWVSENFYDIFLQPTIRDVAFAGIGMRTGDNARFLRMWYEVPHNKLFTCCSSADQASDYRAKWIPYNKGGEFRQWYGNNDYVVNWENNGFEIKENTRKVYPQLGENLGWKISNEQYYFREGITWTVISSKYTSFRRYYAGAIISNSGQSVVSTDSEMLDYLTGLLNSKVVRQVLAILSPTIGFESGYINKIPVIIGTEHTKNIVCNVQNNISISKTDWDSFETSWDFKRHPLRQTPASAEAPPFTKGGQGMEFLPRCKELKPFSSELRTNATKQENHLWYDFLRDFRPRFTRQRIIGSYIVDFFCHHAMLVIELDGSQHYTPEGIEYDKERTRYLNSLGVNVIRFSNNEIDKNFYAACEKIKESVTHPQPPFVKGGASAEAGVCLPTPGHLSEIFSQWQAFTDQQFAQLKANEEELNRIFIEIYGLQDELTPEVEDKDVTIRKADLARDIKSLISYGVGCIFGRYSLDVDGLAYAGGAWETDKYKTFLPDKDNILPITDNAYFDDDLVTRFFKFVEVVYGGQTLGENLDFIAAALYPNANGTAREKIRRYFVNDFYKDHVKIYQKKPIYWQFDSAGKQNGFKALIYLHRYDKYTVARVRTDYLHPLQRKYEAEIKRLEMLSGMTENPREKAEHKKQIEKIEKQLAECRAYDPALAHIAHQAIELDLDDGVTVNYGKFMGIDAGGDKIVDLLTKI